MIKWKNFWNEASRKLMCADYIFILILTLLYGILAFSNLGDISMPQTYFNSTEESSFVRFKLEEQTDISKIRVFAGPSEGTYSIFGSMDGINYEKIASMDLNYVFTWKDIKIDQPMFYFMIESDKIGSSIGEIQLYNINNEKVSVIAEDNLGIVMLDELDLVPDQISYKNSMYFDEIYFARTAYEYANGLTTYEWVHPPLGKLIQAIPIAIHGMSPFTYRMMGTLAGILLIPVIYIFAKELFGKRKYAILAALLMTFDNFHFSQSRMGTIDTHLVLFILTSFLFMFRYLNMKDNDKLKTKLLNLGLSGLFIGCAIATKWTGLFGGLGLAILFFTHYGKHYVKEKEKRKEGYKILASCVGFFVVLPIVIYLICYFAFPKLQPYEIHSISDLLKQTDQMYQYHSNLNADHPFTSKWYTWPMMIKPVWYHVSYLTNTTRETISGIGNPIIWWIGAVAMVYLIALLFEKKRTEIYTLLIAILTLWLPYLFIGRVMFLYHFFPVLPFMMLAIVAMFKEIGEKQKTDKWMIGYIIAVILFFILFYPVSSGMEISNNYLNFIRWANTWTF